MFKFSDPEGQTKAEPEDQLDDGDGKPSLSSERPKARLSFWGKKKAAREQHQAALAFWRQTVAKHRELETKVDGLDADWSMVLDYPAMLDPTVPTTRKLLLELQKADALSSEMPEEISASTEFRSFAYPQAVERIEDAWKAAWEFAQHAGSAVVSQAEQGRVEELKALLDGARSDDNLKAERIDAYRSAQRCARNLQQVKVPEAAHKQLDLEMLLVSGESYFEVAKGVYALQMRSRPGELVYAASSSDARRLQTLDRMAMRGKEIRESRSPSRR